MRPQIRMFWLAQPLPHHRDNKIKLREGAAMIIEEMTPAECFELLQQTGVGRLACARSGQPYVVPIYFAADKDHIYGFSTLGKKIEWMRANPLVCVEVDEIISPAQWRSVVAVGRYQELPDTQPRSQPVAKARQLVGVGLRLVHRSGEVTLGPVNLLSNKHRRDYRSQSPT